MGVFAVTGRHGNVYVELSGWGRTSSFTPLEGFNCQMQCHSITTGSLFSSHCHEQAVLQQGRGTIEIYNAITLTRTTPIMSLVLVPLYCLQVQVVLLLTSTTEEAPKKVPILVNPLLKIGDKL